MPKELSHIPYLPLRFGCAAAFHVRRRREAASELVVDEARPTWAGYAFTVPPICGLVPGYLEGLASVKFLFLFQFIFCYQKWKFPGFSQTQVGS